MVLLFIRLHETTRERGEVYRREGRSEKIKEVGEDGEVKPSKDVHREINKGRKTGLTGLRD